MSVMSVMFTLSHPPHQPRVPRCPCLLALGDREELPRADLHQEQHPPEVRYNIHTYYYRDYLIFKRLIFDMPIFTIYQTDCADQSELMLFFWVEDS